MAAPDHGLHVVLKKKATLGIWKVCGRGKKIEHGAIEAVFSHQILEKAPQFGRMEPLDRYGHRGNQAPRQLRHEPDGVLRRNTMLHRVRTEAVFAAARRPFGFRE